MKKLSLILFSFILFLKPFASAEEFIHGKLRIIDGDTIVIKNQKIRLWGIDAPEMKQICKNGFKKNYNCGIKSKKALEEVIEKKLTKAINMSASPRKINPNDSLVICKTKGKDKYRRVLGICAVDRLSLFHINNSLNAWMVSSGNAVAYKRYSKAFLKHEDEAKINKRGIWQGEFERPEQWRRKNK